MLVFEVTCPLVKHRDTVLLLISAIKINSGLVPAASDPVEEQELPHGFSCAAEAEGFPDLPQNAL